MARSAGVYPRERRLPPLDATASLADDQGRSKSPLDCNCAMPRFDRLQETNHARIPQRPSLASNAFTSGAAYLRRQFPYENTTENSLDQTRRNRRQFCLTQRRISNSNASRSRCQIANSLVTVSNHVCCGAVGLGELNASGRSTA